MPKFAESFSNIHSDRELGRSQLLEIICSKLNDMHLIKYFNDRIEWPEPGFDGKRKTCFLCGKNIGPADYYQIFRYTTTTPSSESFFAVHMDYCDDQ